MIRINLNPNTLIRSEIKDASTGRVVVSRTTHVGIAQAVQQAITLETRYGRTYLSTQFD